MKKIILLLLILTSNCFCIETTIIYVNASKPYPGDGYSWATAFATFQGALDVVKLYASASTPYQIWVAKGTYEPAHAYGTGSSRYYHFRMINYCSIYGGFAGNETSVSQRTDFGPGGSNETILTGDIGNTPGINTDNCYHVFYHPSGLNLNATAVLDGFTITRGYASGGGSDAAGGGMYNYGSSPTITNVTFKSNFAYNGGGMYNYGSSSPTVTNVKFISNTAQGWGGGMYNSYSSSPTATNVTFTSNSAPSGGGGGMYNGASSSPIINNSIIWGNSAPSGKQIYIYAGTISLNYCAYSNGSEDFYGTPSVNNCITPDDPKFVDAANGDFRLKGESPCVDAGNNTYNNELYDIRGIGFPRKLNKTNGLAGTIDIGAYEYKVSIDPLPVTLTFFTAAAVDNGVQLNWQTATEQNNYGFEILRSFPALGKEGAGGGCKGDEDGWTTLGFVNGAGNSNSPKEYTFVDTNPYAQTSEVQENLAGYSGSVQYRLKQIDLDGKFKYYSQLAEVSFSPTDVKEKQLPTEFGLSQNYPNPFNPSTVISYQLPVSGNVILKVYDMLGNEVSTLVNETKAQGYYSVTFSAANLSTGVYIYRITAGSFTSTKKLMLMK